MKRISLLVTLLIFSISIIACQKAAEKIPVPEGTHAVKVLEIIEASSYTYLNVSETNSTFWIAVPKFDAKMGETLYFTKSLEMKNFKSESLNRTFDSIQFVEDISRTMEKKELAAPHPQINLAPVPELSVESLKDGKTIEQIYAEREKLNGQTVRVRGKVVRFNANIMDRNWIHIQDGTGTKGSHDLLVTSQEMAVVGQIIVVEGTLAIDIDLGAGYKYVAAIEKAKITVEKEADVAL